MNLKAIRKKAGLSQADVAKELGVSGAAVCMWEKHITTPSVKYLPSLAKIYGCSIDDLFRGDANA